MKKIKRNSLSIASYNEMVLLERVSRAELIVDKDSIYFVG